MESKSNKLTKDYRETITKLKFLATLSEGDRIDTKNIYIESTNFLTPLKRLFSRESRSTTLPFIYGIIYDSFEVLISVIDSKEKGNIIFSTNIIQDLLNAINGLVCLQKTYSADKMMVCEMNYLIEHINTQLSHLQDKFPLFPFKNKKTD